MSDNNVLSALLVLIPFVLGLCLGISFGKGGRR
jgi:ABC-type molybdate transport system permease subunit